MLANTISITYNAVAYDLNRVRESNYSSEFFYRSATLDLQLQIGHTLPVNGKGEAHVVTLWATDYVDGVPTDKNRVFTRIVSEAAKQDSTKVVNLNAALGAFMTANAAAIADRAS